MKTFHREVSCFHAVLNLIVFFCTCFRTTKMQTQSLKDVSRRANGKRKGGSVINASNSQVELE